MITMKRNFIILLLALVASFSVKAQVLTFDNPGDSFDYRGEGIFMELSYEKRRVKKDGEKKSTLKKTKASLITVMVAADDRYVIRFLDDRLLEVLDEAEYLQWKDYLSKRKKLMESYLPKGDW